MFEHYSDAFHYFKALLVGCAVFSVFKTFMYL